MLSFLIILISVIAYAQIDGKKDFSVKQIYDNLQKCQWRKDTRYIFPIEWEHKKGLYESEIKFNMVDEKNSWKTAKLRNGLKVDDNNMFVTNFVLVNILEAYELGSEVLDEGSFLEAVEQLAQFKDKNQEGNNPVFSFWLQELVNGTWSSSPKNLDKLIDVYPDFPEFVQKWFDAHGLSIFNEIKSFKSAFRIPADNDDSSVNAALDALIRKNKDLLPNVYREWSQLNFDHEQFYETALLYSYRPFEDGRDEIDPRTYYYMHDFIESKHSQSLQNGEEPSLILASTWLIDQESQIHDIREMPIKANNVDLSVNANFLFGLTHQVLAGRVALEGELRQMYGDVGDLLEWAIVSGVPEKRPDISLVYYPSQFDFYWFCSRIVKLIQRSGAGQEPLVGQLHDKLLHALQGAGTDFILRKAARTDDGPHWDEFLGDFAGKQRGEDRLFSSALALNVLMDVWTDREYHWLSEDIKAVVDNGMGQLAKTYNPRQHLENAFFSGSFKTFDTFPFFYPSNVNVLPDGTVLDPQNVDMSKITHGLKCAWKGHASAQEYRELIGKKWYKKDTPQQFEGFNQPGFGFPFWSSHAITHAVSLLAAQKYQLVNE